MRWVLYVWYSVGALLTLVFALVCIQAEVHRAWGFLRGDHLPDLTEEASTQLALPFKQSLQVLWTLLLSPSECWDFLQDSYSVLSVVCQTVISAGLTLTIQYVGNAHVLIGTLLRTSNIAYFFSETGHWLAAYAIGLKPRLRFTTLWRAETLLEQRAFEQACFPQQVVVILAGIWHNLVAVMCLLCFLSHLHNVVPTMPSIGGLILTVMPSQGALRDAGLVPGMMLSSINGYNTSSVESFHRTLEHLYYSLPSRDQWRIPDTMTNNNLRIWSRENNAELMPTCSNINLIWEAGAAHVHFYDRETLGNSLRNVKIQQISEAEWWWYFFAATTARELRAGNSIILHSFEILYSAIRIFTTLNFAVAQTNLFPITPLDGAQLYQAARKRIRKGYLTQ